MTTATKQNSKTILYNNLIEPLSNTTSCDLQQFYNNRIELSFIVLHRDKPFIFGVCECGCNEPLQSLVLKHKPQLRRFKEGHWKRNGRGKPPDDEVEKRKCSICGVNADQVRKTRSG